MGRRHDRSAVELMGDNRNGELDGTQGRKTSISPQGLSLVSANGLRHQHLEAKSPSPVSMSERDCNKGSWTGVVDNWSSECGRGALRGAAMCPTLTL